MDRDSIKNIIVKMIDSRKNVSDKVLLNAILSIEENIFQNKDLILEANLIDIKNNNGFKINFDVIEQIFNNIKKEELIFGKVILSEKNDDKKIIYGKQLDSVGNTIIVFDGNPYVLIEMISKSLLANNAVVFNYTGYMMGTNNLLMNFIQDALEKNNLNKYQIQLYLANNCKELLNNYANIDLVVAVGDRSLQNSVLKLSHNKTITSGYEYFDIYIESTEHLDFIEKILKQNVNINVYNSEKVILSYDSIVVSDIDEAIAQINYNSSKYSVAIFTNNSDNASKFMKEIKAKTVLVNTSPTIERIIDIKETDLMIEKTFIYPIEYIFDHKKNEIETN